MQQSNDSILTDGDMTGDLVSDPMPAGQLAGISFSSYWSGAPVGVIRLQFSNFPSQFIDGHDIPDTSWINIDGTEQDVSTDINGKQNFGWFDWFGAYRWIRCKWEATSGNGLLNVNFNAKAY